MLFKNTFQNMKGNTVETQDGERSANSWDDVMEGINEMFEYEDEFVILTLANISHDVRYVQAVYCDDGITVQLGVEVEGGIKLVEKTAFSEEECVEIFREFYETSNVKNVEKYTEVQF
ncbi:MAG: hypothetical protein K2N06_11590 [Oscillospiraceae bacterium]|nr:hypothetical protein [Oscillospiraceae bacterium]